MVVLALDALSSSCRRGGRPAARYPPARSSPTPPKSEALALAHPAVHFVWACLALWCGIGGTGDAV